MENKTNTSYNDRICKERLDDNAIFSSSSIDIIWESIRFERFDNKWIQNGKEEQETSTTIDKEIDSNLRDMIKYRY